MQLFFSDLHLSPNRPDQIELFIECLQKASHEAASVFILGDLFDFWIGDDDERYPSPEIKKALRFLTGRGTKLYLSVGNRDFLMGEKFAGETGAVLLPDYEVIKLNGESTLITHGDILCTRDKSYQRFRKLVRNKYLQNIFLSLPFSVRLKIASKTQNQTLKSTQKKPMTIMDVEVGEVRRLMKDTETTLLIHGHTHRPGVHEIIMGSQKHRRIVLGDWCDNDPYLFLSQIGKQKLMRVNEYLSDFKT